MRDDDLPLKRKADCCNDGRSISSGAAPARPWIGAVLRELRRGRAVCRRLAEADIDPEGAVLSPQVCDPQRGGVAIGPPQKAHAEHSEDRGEGLRSMRLSLPARVAIVATLDFSILCNLPILFRFIAAVHVTRWRFTRKMSAALAASKFRDESIC